MTRIVGILNLTRDSFSDGGRFLAPGACEPDASAAADAARRMVHDGASLIDIGAESTHPDAEDVPAAEEMRRLLPVIERLLADRIEISVDTHKPAVMRAVLDAGVRWINDVTALGDAASVAAVRERDARIVLMHSVWKTARAQRGPPPGAPDAAGGVVDRVIAFFRERLASLEAAGIARERLVLDPGMGLFVGPDPDASLALLRGLERLRGEFGLPLWVSTSRKSFIGALLDRSVEQRGAGTLASELWAAAHGADYIRTHDVRALDDALTVWRAVAASGRD